MTRNGEQILDIINRSTDHLTAEQIFFQMKQIAPKIVSVRFFRIPTYTPLS